MRLIFAKLMLTKDNVLVLDEPTNHLDLESIVALGDALSKYEGTAFVVTHDRDLIEQFATRLWAFTPQGLVDFHGHLRRVPGEDGRRGGRHPGRRGERQAPLRAPHGPDRHRSATRGDPGRGGPLPGEGLGGRRRRLDDRERPRLVPEQGGGAGLRGRAHRRGRRPASSGSSPRAASSRGSSSPSSRRWGSSAGWPSRASCCRSSRTRWSFRSGDSPTHGRCFRAAGRRGYAIERVDRRDDRQVDLFVRTSASGFIPEGEEISEEFLRTGTRARADAGARQLSRLGGRRGRRGRRLRDARRGDLALRDVRAPTLPPARASSRR